MSFPKERGNDLATVANSAICGVFLSNNSYRMQMYTNKADEKKNIVFFFRLFLHLIHDFEAQHAEFYS